MALTVPVKNVRTLIAVATSNAAAATVRGTADLRSAFGGILTLKLTTGATGPTTQALGNVLIAHNAGATPAAGSAGVDWKTLFSFGSGLGASAITEQSLVIDPSVMHLEVEVTGNTGQAVVCEAIFSEFTSPTT